MGDCMMFPDTVEEYMEQYKIVDREQVYTNGAELVPIFRMKQWFEHLPSAQPDFYDYSDIEPLWESFAKEHDVNLTDGAKQLKDAMWVGYRKGKAAAQPEPQWIPCSERLPENEVRKLVQLDNGWIVAAWWDGKDWYTVPLMYNEFDEHCSLGDGGYCVLAWSECPEPYKGES